MSVIIFIIVLAALIFVHELGHFLAAKISGMRVDEFSIGFPPRIASLRPKGGETTYSLGIIPFGGFVNIFGEDPREKTSGPDSKRSFSNQPKIKQVIVLVSGVLGNIIFAYLLIAIGFMYGLPASADFGEKGVIEDPKVTVTGILPNSPADEAGVMAGDVIRSLASLTGNISGEEVTAESVQSFIGENTGRQIEFSIEREGEEINISVVPEDGLVEGQAAIGIGLDTIGIVKLPFFTALWEAGKATAALIGHVSYGLWHLASGAFTGTADLSNVAGPVGIIGLVDGASALGIIYLLSFTAFISVNLAIINLIPIPALDGGRVLFVIIEKIKGSPIRPSVAGALNAIGFGLLILLMVVITINDIVRLF